MVPNRGLVPEWDFPVRAHSEFENINPNRCQTSITKAKSFAFFGAVVELQGLLRRPTSGVRDRCDKPAGEFHELGGLANDEYQCTPGFTTRERSAWGAERQRKRELLNVRNNGNFEVLRHVAKREKDSRPSGLGKPRVA